MRSRRPLLVAVLAGLVALAGCASEEEVEATQAALDQLEVDLGAMPGVEAAYASMEESTSVPNPTMISVTLVTTSEEEDEILEVIREVARESWHSDIPTIAGLTVDGSPDGSAQRYSTTEALGVPSPVAQDELEEEFGPRGDG